MMWKNRPSSHSLIIDIRVGPNALDARRASSWIARAIIRSDSDPVAPWLFIEDQRSPNLEDAKDKIIAAVIQALENEIHGK